MLLYKYIKYLIFASNGKGHGIHSPFVYDFVVNVLNKSFKGTEKLDVLESAEHFILGKKYLHLINRIKSFYVDYTVQVFQLPFKTELVFSIFGKKMEEAIESDIFIITGLNSSGTAEKKWLEIKKNEKVTCSINLFFIGILFFKKDFKEKLDFMIRF